MKRERAAAALIGGRDDVASFGGEHVDGRSVHVGEHHPLHASGEQTDGHAPLADGRRVSRHARRESAPRNPRREHHGGAQALEETGAAALKGPRDNTLLFRRRKFVWPGPFRAADQPLNDEQRHQRES